MPNQSPELGVCPGSENAGARRFNNPLQRRLFNIAQWIRAESSEVALFSDKIPRSFDAVRTDPTV